MKIFLRKNDYFLTRIIDYNIFGGIANLLLRSRAALGSLTYISFQIFVLMYVKSGMIYYGNEEELHVKFISPPLPDVHCTLVGAIRTSDN